MNKFTILLGMLFITALSYGQIVIFEEDFNADTEPANWWNSASFGEGSQIWTFGSGAMPTGDNFTTNAAIFDDDAAGNTDLHDVGVLKYPSNASGISVDISSYLATQQVTLTYEYALQVLGDPGSQYLYIDIWNQGTGQYVHMKTYDTDTNPTADTIDINAIIDANPGINTSNIKIAFRYDDVDAAYAWGAGIDNVRLIATPMNDTCATAQQVEINSVTSGTSVNATGTGETGCGVYSNNVGVWYYFNIGGPSSIDVWIENASFDSKLAILGGCDVSSCIANNDDGNGGGDALNPRVQFTPGGTPVYIYVVGVGAETGTFDLHVAYSITNDECSGATDLDVQYGMADYAATTPLASTVRAATDSGVPVEVCNGDTGTANDDVWFSFTPNSETAHITVEGDTSFDAIINLFSGNCGSLTLIDCADSTYNGGVEQINATGLTVGEEYFVRVFTYYNTTETTPIFDISVWSDGSGVGIAEATIDGFAMYPNPVENILNLTAQNTIDTVSIYNLLGQEVLQVTPSATQTQVDMSNLPTGAYIVKVQAGEQVGAYNLIKE